MTKQFTPAYKDLERDIERYLDLHGTKGSILGTAAVFGLDEARRAVFEAYVSAGQDEAIVQWLMRHWTYTAGTNPFFDDTMARLVDARAVTRLSRLWRHATGAMIENHRINLAHAHLGGDMPQSIARSRALVMEAFGRWRSALEDTGDRQAVTRLDADIAEFEDFEAGPKPGPADKRKIDASLFREIIGPQAGEEPASFEHIDAIAMRLAGFGAAQIKTFDKLLWDEMDRLNDYRLWALAWLLQDGCSDDCFEAFRAWCILQGVDACADLPAGTEAFARAVNLSGPFDGGALLQVSAIAYQRRAGKALPFAARKPAPLTGPSWDEDNLADTFPELVRIVADSKSS